MPVYINTIFSSTVYFCNSLLRISTLPFNFFFLLLLQGSFIIVILDLEVQRERENNLAILRETFSLPNSRNDVM